MVWKSGQSYSTDLRSRVLAAIDGGNPAKAVAELFQVSVSYIYKALGRRRATGETEARPQRSSWRTTMPPLPPRWRVGRTSPWRSCGHGCWKPIRSRRASA